MEEPCVELEPRYKWNDDVDKDEWFEEYCWVCREFKLVHNDINTNLGDPGFVCKKCELHRSRKEIMKQGMYPSCY